MEEVEEALKDEEEQKVEVEEKEEEEEEDVKAEEGMMWRSRRKQR